MSRKNFSQAFKSDSVAYALAHADRGVAAVAKELGVGYSTLDKWLRDHKHAGGGVRELTAEQKRIKALEKENADLREVNEILKKAAAYFIKNPK